MLLAALLTLAHPLPAPDRCAPGAAPTAAPAPATASTASATGSSSPTPGSTADAGRPKLAESHGPWFTMENYPASALIAHQEGTVVFTLVVDTRGCPVRCKVDHSSGFAVLDDATCKIVLRRARFAPATDAEGNPVASTWTNKFKWEID
jgi:protein TonB